jgi:hypothetical protein
MAYRVAVVGGLSLDCGGGDWVVEREWEPDSLCGLGSFPSPPSLLLYGSSELCQSPLAHGHVWASPSVLSLMLRPR